jgi:hypothetical protein
LSRTARPHEMASIARSIHGTELGACAVWPIATLLAHADEVIE